MFMRGTKNEKIHAINIYDLSFPEFSGELGDYDPEIHEGNYISEHKLLKTQTPTIEEKAMELHQTQLKGFTPEQAENYFLRIASQLDTYAVDPHPVKVIFLLFLNSLQQRVNNVKDFQFKNLFSDSLSFPCVPTSLRSAN